MKRYLIACALLALMLGACNKGEQMKTSSITDVLFRHTPDLMKIPGVVGTAQGEKDGHPAIIIYVKEETDSLNTVIPSSLEGFPVTLQVSGPIGLH
jgi:hypothetical protein